jgi:hypothetical protein
MYFYKRNMEIVYVIVRKMLIIIFIVINIIIIIEIIVTIYGKWMMNKNNIKRGRK